MPTHFTPSDIARFWSKVDRSGGPDACWLWTGKPNRDGYGNMVIGGRYHGAHRLAYLINHGPLEPGDEVCHRCDNPGCVNPAHLFKGTHSDNMRDAFAKGRAHRPPPPRPEQVPFGERVNTCKLTSAQVADIRARCRFGKRHQGGNVSDLAAEYGVSVQTIYHIARRKTRRRD